ncbi:uncharacterized protein LOC113239989 [Hyposmocoma kahamanoa]|uniref:uncharacterized protein LOC113239989 n=1 Tax=Hyposmocoma kahamanoa TaxID=1477025 RepID=UPI000E6D9469|nr:uncharacterized protein LOC113239989 [Hyposmocoma kahamanoa]
MAVEWNSLPAGLLPEQYLQVSWALLRRENRHYLGVHASSSISSSHRKVCINCGVPGMGTTMHLELGSQFGSVPGSMTPYAIPSEYLLSRLIVIDLRLLVKNKPNLVLTKDMALQWRMMRYDTKEPTMFLFNFGRIPDTNNKNKKCACHFPGISYELAEWIAANLTHVVAIATDAPSIESEQTRELTDRTISNLLGKSGIYMIENVNVRKNLPEQGCVAMAMPLKLENVNYVPTRLTAFCPESKQSDTQVVLVLKNKSETAKLFQVKDYDDMLVDILQQ